MKKQLLIILALLLSGIISVVEAAPAPPPLHNVEISGNVTFAGKPVANIQLEILGGGCANSPDVITQTKTDQQGHYRFFLPTTSYYVLIAANGYKSGVSNPLYATDCPENGLQLQGSNNKKRYDIRLKQALPPSPEEQECRVSGGRWEQMDDHKGCNTYYPDGGKSCTDGAQCAANICIIQRVGGTMGYDAGFCPINTYTKTWTTLGIMKDGKPVSTSTPEVSGSWWFQQVQH